MYKCAYSLILALTLRFSADAPALAQEVNTYALSNITTNDIQIFVKSNYLTPQMNQAMDGITDLRISSYGCDRRRRDCRRSETICNDSSTSA